MKSCNQCGKCCIKYGGGGLHVTEDELSMWELFNPEIFEYQQDGKIWVDPETGKVLEYCPWLEKLPGRVGYGCQIYFNRPDDCRQYPSTVQEMIADACEMIEEKDVQSPQVAQRRLDIIMSDTRPLKNTL